LEKMLIFIARSHQPLARTNPLHICANNCTVRCLLVTNTSVAASITSRQATLWQSSVRS
jgi:hypothetical protein